MIWYYEFLNFHLINMIFLPIILKQKLFKYLFRFKKKDIKIEIIPVLEAPNSSKRNKLIIQYY